MRLLLVSAGPNPDPSRSNGYLDALPRALAARGNEVFQLHLAGIGPWYRGLYVERSERDGTHVFSVKNSQVYAGLPPGAGGGTAQPRREIRASGRLRAAVRAILRETHPEVVHLQNLFGLPADLVGEFRSAGASVVLTAHDYSSICPTAHLFRPEGHNCTLSRDELTCSQCCRDSLPFGLFRLRHEFDRSVDALRPGSLGWRMTAGLRNGLVRLATGARRLFSSDVPYRQRFDAMHSLLHRLDVVHCISQLQADRLQRASGGLSQLKVLPLVPPSVQRCSAVPRAASNDSLLRISVLNVLPGRVEKGWFYLRAVLDRISLQRQDFQVDWYAEGDDTATIRYRGRYAQNELDRIAADSDFCLIPSLWHETLGFTGVEMLSRGVPLICSRRCGVAEAVQHGITGLLFDPEGPAALEQALHRVLDDRPLARTLRQAQAVACGRLPTFADHVQAIENLLAGSRRSLEAR